MKSFHGFYSGVQKGQGTNTLKIRSPISDENNDFKAHLYVQLKKRNRDRYLDLSLTLIRNLRFSKCFLTPVVSSASLRLHLYSYTTYGAEVSHLFFTST